MAAEPTIPSSTIGAACELLAATHLMLQGYEVFRALSPACSCDLTALKNSLVYRFEVRSAVRNQNGIAFSKENIRAENLILVFRHENRISLLPETPFPIGVGPSALDSKEWDWSGYFSG